MKPSVSFYIDKLLSLICWMGLAVGLWIGVQVFCFTSFTIPSHSMEPILVPGDRVVVNKMIPGARLFNLFSSLRGEQVSVYRMPGMGKLKRNDVVVFHFPHPHTWDKLEMHMLKYYIKRCIGLPGDSLWIRNGRYQLKGIDGYLGNRKGQEELAGRSEASFPREILTAFPHDSLFNWTILNFGPLYLPKAGDSIPLTRSNYVLYKQAIEWELQKRLGWRDSVCLLQDIPLKGYRFRKNYYFVAGDEVNNSQDSRYWGVLPDDFIVGKAWLIWKSVDPGTGKTNSRRFLKRIDAGGAVTLKNR